MELTRADVLVGFIRQHGFRYGAEIGVGPGPTTKHMLDSCPDLKLIAVDNWPADYPTYSGRYGDPGPAFGAREQNRRREQFMKKVHNRPGRVRLIEKASVEAALEVDDGSLDFVFIDADHTYEGCKADIEAWLPKVRSGGLVTGHDYAPEFPGVVQAVDETFGKPATYDDHVWAWPKP